MDYVGNRHGLCSTQQTDQELTMHASRRAIDEVTVLSDRQNDLTHLLCLAGVFASVPLQMPDTEMLYAVLMR